MNDEGHKYSPEAERMIANNISWIIKWGVLLNVLFFLMLLVSSYFIEISTKNKYKVSFDNYNNEYIGEIKLSLREYNNIIKTGDKISFEFNEKKYMNKVEKQDINEDTCSIKIKLKGNNAYLGNKIDDVIYIYLKEKLFYQLVNMNE